MRRPAVRAALVAFALLVATIGLASPTGARASFTAHQLRPDGHPIQGSKALSTQLARTDRSLLGLSGSKLTPVIVKFDYDSVASYAGGVAGLRATSPSVTGTALTAARARVDAYSRYVANRESQIVGSIRAHIPNVRIGASFRMAYGGVAMQVPANRIADLLRVPGVVAVQRDKLEQPQTDTTPHFLGADQVWPTLGGQTHAGENVLVGVLDTGIWPEHPSFADNGIGPISGSFGCEFGDGSDPLLGDPFTCNDKLVGAYAFTDTYLSVFPALPGEFCNNATHTCSARDPDGHGTHTSSTAVGDAVPNASIFGINRGDISGMAPGAHLIMYRVCLEQGCFNSDSIEAVNQAIIDGVQVINFSIGGGANPYTDAVELAFLDAYASNILVNASAGNSGPGPATADHGGPWVNTVGASTSPRHWLTTAHLTAGNGDTFDAQGASITPGIATDTPVVSAGDVPSYNDPECNAALPPGSVTGQIVVCIGEFNRNLRVFNVLQGGGVGVLLVVPPPGPGNLFTDNFWVPTVTVNSPSPGIDLLDFVDTHTGIVAHWDTGSATAVTPDVMTSFSSRGPVGDFLKPDVTAPGIEILAGHTPEPISVFGGPPGEFFQVIAGTSMSSPHAAGVSALVRAVHPDWTPGQVKSALMTSAVTSVFKEDGTTPADPFDDGAGSIRANAAVRAGLTFDETAANYFAAAGDPLGRIDLNTPSVDAPVMPGVVTTTRTALNVSGANQKYTASVVGPGSGTITVSPSSFTVKNDETVTLTITINGTSLPEGQYFGRITLKPKSSAVSSVTMPVAFFKTQGDVALTHTCSPTTIHVNNAASCQVTATNLAPVTTSYDLSLTGPAKSRLQVQNVSAPGVPSGNGFTASGSLSPSLGPPITGIAPTVGPAGEYLPLSLFGVTPIPGMGDETLVNFNTDPFTFGTEVYSRLGVTSDGYLVIGGGGSDDLDFIPQTFPDPNAPNNVLAPFWTDLNPGAGGAVRIAGLTDGTDDWLVIDWDGVPTFGTPQLQSFEIWIQTTAEAITYSYGTVTGTGASDGLNVGAENRDGTSGVNLGSVPASGDELAVTAGSPVAGGSVTITYDALGKKPGTYVLLATLETDITPGETTAPVTVRVT